MNMHITKKIQKICKTYAQIKQIICKKYANNMHNIQNSRNIQEICRGPNKCAAYSMQNMKDYAKKYAALYLVYANHAISFASICKICPGGFANDWRRGTGKLWQPT